MPRPKISQNNVLVFQFSQSAKMVTHEHPIAWILYKIFAVLAGIIGLSMSPVSIAAEQPM